MMPELIWGIVSSLFACFIVNINFFSFVHCCWRFMYIELIVGYSTLAFILETYLTLRQRKCYKLKEIPPKIAKYQCVTHFFNKETFLKAQSYNLDKNTFGLIKSTFDFVTGMATILCGLFPLFWKFASVSVEKLGFAPDNEVLKTLQFGFITSVLSDIIDIPFDVYFTFVLEERHGFNKQTPKVFIKDLIKSFFLKIIIGAPLIILAVKIINYFGSSFWIYIWISFVVFGLIMQWAFPTLIVPLFYTMKPFPEGEMKTKILNLLKSVHFPLSDLKEIDGSTRSAHSNAMFTGIFKKNVFVYDTLVDNTNPDDMVAIIAPPPILAITEQPPIEPNPTPPAHELGHWSDGHIRKRLVLTDVYLLIMLYIGKFFIFDKALYADFGFYSEQPVYVGFSLFILVLSPIEMFINFIFNELSRYFEYQADDFATRNGFSLVIPLVKLSKDNLSTVCPDPLYSRFYNSHPTIIERIDAIVNSAKKYDVQIKTEYTDEDERLDNEFMKKQKEERERIKKIESGEEEGISNTDALSETKNDTISNESLNQNDSSMIASEKE